MAEPSAELVDALAAAMGTFDPLAAWYLDLAEPRVLQIKNGYVVDHPELDPDAIDRDEDRYVEIPAATDADEHDWLADFQDEHGGDWPHIRLDQKRGATKRFLKALTKSRPQAVTAWESFRTERLRELARAWIEERPEA